MGIVLSYSYTCDVCRAHIADTAQELHLNMFGPTVLPAPAYTRMMGSRVLCERCYEVLNNVAAAIAPGMLKPEIEPPDADKPTSPPPAVLPIRSSAA